MKKRIIFALKISITIIILYFIFERISISEVFHIASRLNPLVFLLLLFTSAVKLITQYINWEYCLRINKGYIPTRKEAVRTLFIGCALRFLLPGGHGTYGKVYFLNYKKKRTLLSIIMEKFMLTWTVLLFGSWAAFFYFSKVHVFWRSAIVILIIFVPLIAYWSRHLFIKKNRPESNSRQILFKNCIRIVPAITLSQAFYIFLTIFQYFIIINQYQVLRMLEALKSVPLILTANTIPITYSGLGLRESFALYIFKEYAIDAEVAVTASLLIFLINSVIPALIGTYFIITSKKKSKLT